MAGLLKEITSLPSSENITSGGGDYIHIKQGDADRKIRVYDLFKWHTVASEASTNPHGTTKTDVGLANVLNEEQLVTANNLSELSGATEAQAVRDNLDLYNQSEVETLVSDHSDLTNNPHSVTKSQVGLGNVNNWLTSSDETEVSDTKFATIGAVARVGQALTDYQDSLLGEVKMWFGETPPDGWLEIKGQSYVNLIDAGYPLLAEQMRDQLGGSNPSYPDTRGLFPRAWDNGAGVDSGRAIGSTQTDLLASHDHTASTNGSHNHDRGDMEITGDITSDDRIQQNPNGAFFKDVKKSGSGSSGGGATGTVYFEASRTWTGNTSSDGDHTHTIDSTGGAETRPKNFSIMFIIKHD